ncbi:MAG: hypothetical protein FJ206_00220 [Gemmatimonadetes bacterium]|nr:hypothetical protein [Gemmatimonadota bacterium]
MSFNAARTRVRKSPASRTRLLGLGITTAAIGVVIALGFPQRFGINPESPAAILPYLLFWTVGGALACVGLGTAAGAGTRSASRN